MYLFGAVNPLAGDSSALLAPLANTEYMDHHLRFISEQVGPDVQVVLVLDRAGCHLSKALQVPENITFLHLPPYSPDPQQEKLFKRPLNQYRWTQIRRKLGLSDFTFHDLRKTFGSVLAQKGVSTAVTQRLLEHSSSDLTNKVYTNVDPVLRKAVDLIPVGDWL